MSQSFSTTVSDWQGVDDVPTEGSDNLVESGGVADNLINTASKIDVPASLTNEGAIYMDGTLSVDGNYYHTDPIYFYKGDYVSFTCRCRDTHAAISLYENNSYTPLLNGTGSVSSIKYVILKSGYYVFTGLTSAGISVSKINNSISNLFANTNSLSEDISVIEDNFISFSEKTPVSVSLNNSGAVNMDGTLTQDGNYYHTNIIAFVAGDYLFFNCRARTSHAVLSQYKNGNYIPLVAGTGSASDFVYLIKESGNYVFTGLTNAGISVSKINNSITQLMLSIGLLSDNFVENLFTPQNINIELSNTGAAVDVFGKINTYFTTYSYSNPIQFSAGDALIFSAYASNQVSLISIYENGKYTPWLLGDGNKTYYFLVTSNVELVFSSAIAITMTKISNFFSREIAEASNNKNWSIGSCPTVYQRKEVATGNSIKINNSLYPEGFVLEKSPKLVTINGGRECPLYDGTENDAQITLKRDGYIDKKLVVKKRLVDLSLIANKKAFVLCIGESTTEASRANPYTNTYDKFWGWPSALQYFYGCDNIDFNNGNIIKTIGRKNRLGLELPCTHNGTTFTNRSFHEGFGGHTSYFFTHYAFGGNVNLNSVNNMGGRALWYFLGLATKTPYSQSSYNAQSEEYTGSAEQIALITHTSMGFYKVDGNSTLWSVVQYLGAQEGYPQFTDSSAYTGSAAQIAELQAWAELCFASPENPFFDISKVRSNTNYYDPAFSLTKYLERYRTMDNAGNRLIGSAGETVTGQDGNTYTIGTLVSNTSDYDVCMPTHIVFNVGINDSGVLNTVENHVSNIKELVSLTNLPTAFFICRFSGVCSKEVWSDVANATELNSVGVSELAVLVSVESWFESQEASGKYLLPCYQIQVPISGDGEFLESSISTLTERLWVNNGVHTSYVGYRSIGVQVLNWLYYTLSD